MSAAKRVDQGGVQQNEDKDKNEDKEYKRPNAPEGTWTCAKSEWLNLNPAPHRPPSDGRGRAPPHGRGRRAGAPSGKGARWK